MGNKRLCCNSTKAKGDVELRRGSMQLISKQRALHQQQQPPARRSLPVHGNHVQNSSQNISLEHSQEQSLQNLAHSKALDETPRREASIINKIYQEESAPIQKNPKILEQQSPVKLDLIQEQEESFDQYEIRSTAFQKPHTPNFWKEDNKEQQTPQVNQRQLASSAKQQVEVHRNLGITPSERPFKVIRKYIGGPGSVLATDVFSQDSRGAEVFAFPNPQYQCQPFGGSRDAALTHFLRLTIYAYLNLKEVITKISSLNTHERNFLQSSAIANVNKCFTMEMRQLRGGELRWAYPNPRDGLEIQEQSLIPVRLASYIPRVVSKLQLTVDLNRCSQLSELSTMVTTLPTQLDNMAVSLEIIDGPAASTESNSKTLSGFANDLKLLRNDLVFKQIDYRGSGALTAEVRAGLAYLFKRVHTLKLWDATIDMSDFALDEPVPLKHLSLDYSTFFPHNQSKGYQLRLESFKAIKSNWPANFRLLSNIATLESLEIIEPERQDFLGVFLEENGPQLSSLISFQYMCRRDKQIHSMQYLLPRASKLQQIAFATKQTNYRRDSQRRNIYNRVCLSQLLDLQYTKVSQHSTLQLNELVIDLQIHGFDRALVEQVTMEGQDEPFMYVADDYRCVMHNRKHGEQNVEIEDLATGGRLHVKTPKVSCFEMSLLTNA